MVNFERDKSSLKMPEVCGQTVLPDRSTLIGQKLVENAKIENLICDILGDFKHCENVLKLRSERKKMCQH